MMEKAKVLPVVGFVSTRARMAKRMARNVATTAAN
jgi:hypothetical protein